MTAYVVVLREEPVRDPAEMAEYQRKAQAGAGQHAMIPLALYGALQPLEGALPDGVVILEFATRGEAEVWYNSDQYQDAAKHRIRSAKHRVFIVDGFQAD